ncbi:hypothetical protein N7495_002762 [Penicillium taxi]|uniref:uncharacterized protein n=1 Tax=Penicillium taxi TaxID=168475 RepID=UPI002545624C|nr:uncharacterized protein N7495_002762 [Penicillium taxi]KAJ5902234.1 hypothetical protein N7495_002762 [Penicillium taxi]
MAKAHLSDIRSLIDRLGFGSVRAGRCLLLAKEWARRPPCKKKRYGMANYPEFHQGLNVKEDECLDEYDPRFAWEIAGFPGVGPYSMDSWRIFCRDELRGKATDWKGTGAPPSLPSFLPEWKQVVPRDKELCAYLSWMWLKEGFIWNHGTGETTRASGKMMRAAKKGRVAMVEIGDAMGISEITIKKAERMDYTMLKLGL